MRQAFTYEVIDLVDADQAAVIRMESAIRMMRPVNGNSQGWLYGRRRRWSL
jgi:hypothetical protein